MNGAGIWIHSFVTLAIVSVVVLGIIVAVSFPYIAAALRDESHR